MKRKDAKIGARVRTLRAFSGVPKGTQGVVDEDYGHGVMVAWDLPGRPLPKGYKKFSGRFAVSPWHRPNLLRDGFSYEELKYLEVVG